MKRLALLWLSFALFALFACTPSGDEPHDAGHKVGYFSNANGLSLAGQTKGAIAYFDGDQWSPLPAPTNPGFLSSPTFQTLAWATPASGDWQTAGDYTISGFANQTIGTDTTFTVGGIGGWRKINSAGDGTAAAIVASSGFVLTPASSTDINASTVTAPLFGPQLSVIVSNYSPTMPLRIWGHASHNITANYDAALLGALVFSSGIQPPNILIGKFGISPAGTGAGSNVDSLSGSNASYDSAGLADNVFVVVLPDGAYGLRMFAYSGVWSSGWPAATALHARGYADLSQGGAFTNNPSVLLDGTHVYAAMGAQRAGSGTALQVTYSNLRVDYKF